MDRMTSKERMLVACQNGMPDRVPVAPDISNMVPCRLTGKPFWDIYVSESPPLWRAYIEAVRYFGIDGWFIYGDLKFRKNTRLEILPAIVEKSSDRWTVKKTYRTPDGYLTETIVNPASNPPTLTEKMIKNFKEDFCKIRHLYSGVEGYDDELFKCQSRELGELGMMCVSLEVPGLQCYSGLFDGSLEAATFAYYDEPELFEEIRILQHKQTVRMAELAIEAGVESILIGASGSITLQSPGIWRELSLPTIQKVSKMCQEAGVISGIHSCGKERYLLETCAYETDIDYVNPLEIPPMGDCNLAECNASFGSRIALMGNLHTTSVMLFGSADDVRRESLKAILVAGTKGGFVLSTGDQCGRDTPDENIRAMVTAAEEFGDYPLDIDKIKAEIVRLECRTEVVP